MSRSSCQLRVHPNGRFLTRSDGRPFFWLGDTAWELFNRLTIHEAETYLKDRARKGFTVIQAVALSELGGPEMPNANGDCPFIDRNPRNPNPAYWKHVDAIVEMANSLGLIIGFLPTWGRWWELFSPTEGLTAKAYGEWLGQRYRDAHLVWILGGDRRVETEAERQLIRNMADGLSKGDGGRHLRTFHTQGACGSSQYFHTEPWLDFNFRQNGHTVSYTGRYDQTRVDYDRIPPKPVIDGEPVYEDIGIDFNAAEHGHATAADVRRALYWNLFSGAFGHTYGHNSVWQMWTPERDPVLDPILPWREALDQPGAGQMQHARKLLEPRPFFSRIPDQSILVPDTIPTLIPGAGRYFFAATRDSTGSYAMVYAPVSRPIRVRMQCIQSARTKAAWFNPRDGTEIKIGTFSTESEHTFTPPHIGETLDWILTLDAEPAENTQPHKIKS